MMTYLISVNSLILEAHKKSQKLKRIKQEVLYSTLMISCYLSMAMQIIRNPHHAKDLCKMMTMMK